ncbi:MAG: efflux RND transporter permease subunit, partial [Candidatus Binatia bacterium]
TLPGVNHDLIDSIAHRTCRYLRQDGGVIMFPPCMWSAPATDAQVDEIRRIVHYSENLHGILVSLDDRAALIRLTFHEHGLDYRRLFEEIDRRIVEPFSDDETIVWVAGEPRLYGWIYHYNSEVYWIFAACIVTGWTMLYGYFHDWRGALRPTVTAVVSAIWGLGAIRLMGFAIDPLALVIPFFATARALSHSVQMHDRYYEEYRANGWEQRPAIVNAFAELFVPTLAGIVTDALGLLVMMLVPIVMLQRVAVWASIWVASVALSELALNPIVYSYLRPPEPERVIRRERGIFQRSIRWAAGFVVGARTRWAWVAIWVAVTLGAFTQWRHITVGDPTAASPLVHLDSPYNRAHTRIQEIFGGVEPLIVVVEGNDTDSLHEPAVLETMEEFQRAVDADPDVGYSFSLADVVKTVHMVYFDLNPRFGVIPISRGQNASVLAFAFGGVSPSESTRYLNLAHSDAHVTFFCRNHQGDTVARIIRRCRDFIAAHPSDRFQFRLATGLVGVTAA